MIFYAIVRATRGRVEWKDFYVREDRANEVCASMNANLNRRTIPYEVVAVTPQP